MNKSPKLNQKEAKKVQNIQKLEVTTISKNVNYPYFQKITIE